MCFENLANRVACRLLWASLLWVAVTAQGLAPGIALAQRGSLVVLGLSSDEGDDARAAALTAALRDEAAGDPAVQLSSSRASLSQMTMVQDCEIAEAACRERIGKALDADHVIYGYLRRSGPRAHEVELHLFATQDGSEQSVRRTFPADQTGDSDTVAQARTLLAALRGEPEPSTPTEEGLPPVATVTPDVQPLSQPQDAEEPPASDGASSNDWIGYTLLGVGAVSAGLTVFSWTQINSAESDEDFRTYSKAVGTVMPMSDDVCAQADRNRTYNQDPEVVAGARSACDRGPTFELLQYVFLGAALVSVGFGTYLLLDDESDERAARVAPDFALRAGLSRDGAAIGLRWQL